MQRVLSFPTGRGFGEASELVTKRMCFSFLFSVGFLCLLGGFLLGRFAAERSIDLHKEKIQLQIAGNGLENTKYIEHFLLQSLRNSSFNNHHFLYLKDAENRLQIAETIENILLRTSFIHKVTKAESHILAITSGSHEYDRFVTLSVSGDGIEITLELIKTLQRVHLDFGWKPRRSLIFCIFWDQTDPCYNNLSKFIQSRLFGYIAVHGKAIRGEEFSTSGSDIVVNTVIEAAKTVPSPYVRGNKQSGNTILDQYDTSNNKKIHTGRLSIDIPHATLSFMNPQNSSSVYTESTNKYHKILAQIVGATIWRLSESLVLKWNPKYLNSTVLEALKTIEFNDFEEFKESITEALSRLVRQIGYLNQQIEKTDWTKPLDVRMNNDLLLDLDRILLCSNKKLESKSDPALLSTLYQHSASVIMTHLDDLKSCYELANQYLEVPCGLPLL